MADAPAEPPVTPGWKGVAASSMSIWCGPEPRNTKAIFEKVLHRACHLLTERLGEVWFVEVGGLTTATKATTGAVDITAREQARSLIVVDGSQQVFTRSGSGWAKVTSGPSELAYSG